MLSVVAVGFLFAQVAKAVNLYWKIIDSSGRVIGNASTDSANSVAKLENQLQATYPGIKLSISECRQPTLVESMEPAFGKSWQCGVIVYRGTVVSTPQPKDVIAKFPPSNSQWHYFGTRTSNNVFFVNEPHSFSDSSIFVWVEDYNMWALAEMASQRSGIEVIPSEIDKAPEAVHRAAEEIVRTDPEKLGLTHSVTGRAQKTLYEINCASTRIRSVQDIDSQGTVWEMPNPDARWFKPVYPDPRRDIFDRICAR